MGGKPRLGGAFLLLLLGEYIVAGITVVVLEGNG
jgi:hypothetical protein